MISTRIAVLLIVSLPNTIVPAHAASWTVQAHSARLVNGAPVLFQVKPPMRLDSLNGRWMGAEVSFAFDATTETWFALAGVSIETAPGLYTLELTGETYAGKEGHKSLFVSHKFAVTRAGYPRIRVRLMVDNRFTDPNQEQLEQIEDDHKVKMSYLSRISPEQEWSGRFVEPTHAKVSDVFGSQRIFNGKTTAPHLGIDFSIPSGTPVDAMNDGTVLLARPLYFEGNLVVLDHGQGLLTLYLHLSEFTVKEGDRVKRSQKIGLSGSTGRVTGPHLHVAVRWRGMYLDPAALMRLRLP